MKTYFNDKDRERLLSNGFTYSVEESKLSFTKRFKELFWDRYMNKHQSPYMIFVDCGYSLDLIGRVRVDNFVRSLKDEFEEYGAFHDGFKIDWREAAASEVPAASSSQAQTLVQIQSELEYVKQELEFLKKTFNAITSKK